MPVIQIVTHVSQTQGCRTQSQIAPVVFIQKTKSHHERERQRSTTGFQNQKIYNTSSKKTYINSETQLKDSISTEGNMSYRGAIHLHPNCTETQHRSTAWN